MSQSFTVKVQCTYEIDIEAETPAEAVTAALGEASSSDNQRLHNAVVTKVEANGWPIVIPWGNSYLHAGF
jgi:hypothetical protein